MSVTCILDRICTRSCDVVKYENIESPCQLLTTRLATMNIGSLSTGCDILQIPPIARTRVISERAIRWFLMCSRTEKLTIEEYTESRNGKSVPSQCTTEKRCLAILNRAKLMSIPITS